jgi:hypothetical protein
MKIQLRFLVVAPAVFTYAGWRLCIGVLGRLEARHCVTSRTTSFSISSE